MEGVKFTKRVHLVIDQPLYDQVVKEVDDNPYIYNSVSHYIRCAIINKSRVKKIIEKRIGCNQNPIIDGILKDILRELGLEK
jgi:hypothetical protein